MHKLDWYQVAINAIIKKYECPVCPKSYETYSGCYNHIKQEHTIEQIKEICSE